MVRPNHDIPNLLVGGIRDYADQQDIDNADAHAQLLRIGLKEVDILPSQTDTDTAPRADVDANADADVDADADTDADTNTDTDTNTNTNTNSDTNQ